MALCRLKGSTLTIGINTFSGLVLAILFSCNAGNGGNPVLKKKADSVFKIPYIPVKEINHTNFEKTFCDAKWRLYCMYCDSPVRIWRLEHLSYGQINFILCEAQDSNSRLLHDIKGEIIKNICYLAFADAYKDTTIDYYWMNTPRDKRHEDYSLYPEISGLVYSLDNPEIPLLARDLNGFGNYRLNEINTSWGKKHLKKFRLLYPMQPEVIYYIRENATKIDPWFYSEAKKRGVFDSTKYPPEKLLKEIEINRNSKDKVEHWSQYK